METNELLELTYAALIDAQARRIWIADAQAERMQNPAGYAAWAEANPVASRIPLAVKQVWQAREVLIGGGLMPSSA